uniref:hypothetical protein n=1 Tax=uncultured Allobacillus sp. TaxID=1638025 RepID=UPI002598E0F8|nr:hypothetical protein [uncultured Allobacillus sp.]
MKTTTWRRRKPQPALAGLYELENNLEKAVNDIGLVIESLHEGLDTKNYADQREFMDGAINDLEMILNELKGEDDDE